MPFRFNFPRRKSPLADITLDHVLSGDTCEPISLSDFETYLEHKEYSIENLHFVSWYQNYRRKFFALCSDLQSLSPPPSLGSQKEHDTIPSPNPARTEQRIEASYRHFESALLATEPKNTSRVVPTLPLSHPQSPTFSTHSESSNNAFKSQPSSPLLIHASVNVGPASTYTLNPSSRTEQPFRHECERVVQTFVRTGGSKEIVVDGRIRDMVIRDLTWTTHPDIFLPIYEQAYDTLSTVSLPHFLKLSSTNVNPPKAMFWLRVGMLNLTIALVVSIATILSIDDYTLRKKVSGGWNSGGESRLAKARAWRLFAVPCATLGGMQFWSAYKGFCSDVWGRGRTQLRPWELDLIKFDGTFDEDPNLATDIELARSDSKHSLSGGLNMDKTSSNSSTSSSSGPNTISSAKGLSHDVRIHEADRASLTSHSWSKKEMSTTRIPPPRIDTDFEAEIARLATLFTIDHDEAPWSENVPVDHVPSQESLAREPTSLGLLPRASRPHSSLQVIAPFSQPPPSPRPQSPSDSASAPNGISSQDSPPYMDRFGEGKAIPMFGPERIVLDKRIAAVHRQTLVEMLWIGLVWGTVFTAGVLAIPGRRW
ncbi:hypothetical protein QCA50_000789 [Cerrena zonata]|uniref:RGS domain-containing protein n=1 Tax=Cerrena zonata TaxID=2478898 RepID=A0AAW0GXC9_9APHY